MEGQTMRQEEQAQRAEKERCAREYESEYKQLSKHMALGDVEGLVLTGAIKTSGPRKATDMLKERIESLGKVIQEGGRQREAAQALLDALSVVTPEMDVAMAQFIRG